MTQEQLEQGSTGDVMWDAMQRYMVRHGELHNNLRMPWGKAVLPWVADPASALRMTLHLNNKYAAHVCRASCMVSLQVLLGRLRSVQLWGRAVVLWHV